MSGFLVALPDRAYTRKERSEMLPTDAIVFDGPGAFASTERLQRELEAEIAAAGGLDAWRAQGTPQPKAA